MSMWVAYGALLTGICVWLLIVRKLTVKPWEAQLVVDDYDVEAAIRRAPARVGLSIFLAVITSLFALFISAYYMRRGHGHEVVNDWTPLAEPTVLWLNTALLVFGSLAMQWAKGNVVRGRIERTREALLAGGLLTLAFLAGQFFAWQQIRAAGLMNMQNPAVAFFYLLTAIHGLHLLGGLVVWGKTALRMRDKRVELIDVRMSIELCTTYWHYLLLVWLVLFALLLST